MFDDNNLVDAILENSVAVLIVQQVQAKLYEEQKRRQEFYETITEREFESVAGITQIKTIAKKTELL